MLRGRRLGPALAALTAALAACGTPPAEAPVPGAIPAPPREAPRVPGHPPVAAPVPADGTPVKVVVVPEGLSGFYTYFFQYREGVEALERALSPLAAAPRVEVRARFDDAVRAGTVRLVLPPGEPAAAAVAAAFHRAGVLDLAPLHPWLEAVAAYRDFAGSRFDLRVFSFRSGLEVALPDGGRCALAEAPGGPPDPYFGDAIACRDGSGAAFEVAPPAGQTWPARPTSARAGGVDLLVTALGSPPGPPSPRRPRRRRWARGPGSRRRAGGA